MANGRLVVSADGETAEGSASMDGRTVRVVHVLAVDGDGQPTKFTVAHLVDHGKMMMEGPDGQVEETDEPNPLQSQIVVFEHIEGEWKKELFGNPPTPDQDGELQSYTNPFDEDTTPRGEVEVGESWTVEGTALRKFLGVGIRDLSGSMTERFDRVVEHNGEPSAVIISQLTVTGTMPDPEGHKMTASLSGNFTTHRSLKSLCDETHGEGVVRFEGTAEEGGATVRVRISGPINISGEVTGL